MRKRRVGVTARSRQIEGSQATGSLQFASEMAAPLELRTPIGTCGENRKQSAYGSMVTMAGESEEQIQSEKRWEGKRAWLGRSAPKARMRRYLILRQGASPLRHRPPFPRSRVYRTEG